MREAIKVCVPGYGHWWFWLVTYDSQLELCKAVKAHIGHDLVEGEDIEGAAMACFTDNMPFRGPYLGIMRLYDTSVETIIHESVHAAVCLAKKVHGKSRTLSHSKEEAIAYGTEAIAAAVVATVHPDGAEIHSVVLT